MIALSEKDFDSILANTKKFVVKAGAPWCGPCKALEPKLLEFEEQHKEIPVFDLNVDENPNFGEQFKLRSVPTILFFKEGEVKASCVGNVSILTIEENLKKIL